MKRSIRSRIAAAVLAALILVISVTGCSSAAKSRYKFGIIAQIENGAFTDMRDGILEALKANGYTADNADFVYKSAQGDMTALSTIASSMDDGTYTAVFTIGTAATQQFVNLGSDTPCFFCAVSAPTAAQVITDMNHPDKNATGTSNAIPVDKIVGLAKKLTPNVKKWGVIYCTSQTNAVNTAKSCMSYMKQNGIAYEEASVTEASEVKTAATALIAKGVDAIFVPNDQIIQSTISSLTDPCLEAGVPTYCSSATTVASGCFATLAIDDKGIGKKTVEIALRHLKDGKAVKDIPSQVVGIDYCSVNRKVLNKLGVKVPADLGYPVKYLGNP